MSDLNELVKGLEQLQKISYERGWSDAIACLNTQAKKIASGQTELQFPIKPSQPKTVRPVGADGGVVISTIYDVIKERPGRRGVDIFREVATRIPDSNFKTLERSGRTALKRLKIRGLVYQRMKLWYPKKSEDALENILD